MKISQQWEKEFRKELIRLLVTELNNHEIDQEVFYWRNYPEDVSSLEAAQETAWLYLKNDISKEEE